MSKSSNHIAAKYPVSIFLVYDKDLKNKRQYYEKFYRLLCRDVGNLNALNSSIPLHVYSNENICSIFSEFLNNKKNIVFIIADDNMLYNKDIWDVNLQKLCSKKTNVAVLPIAESKYAYSNSHLKRYNLVSSENKLNSESYAFDSQILDFCIRFLSKKNRLKLFISHTKKDEDGYGEKTAKLFRDTIYSSTKFEAFFDANTIPNGSDFGKVIEKNARNSLLLILNSDNYSSRDWCQREIYYARKNDCPYVVVDLINNTVNRLFPYIGNAPCIRYNNNIDYIIWTLLKTALNCYYEKEFLNYIVKIQGLTSTSVISGVPDLFKVSRLNCQNILYPAPPLSFAESQILRRAYPSKTFLTPINCNKLNLKRKKIAFSISNPSDVELYGGSNLLLNDLIMEIARYILACKGHIVYGGDLRKSGFTESFLEAATSYIEDNKIDYVVTNYLSSSEIITKEDFLRYSQKKVNLIQVPFLEKYKEVRRKVNDLSSMRTERNKNTNVLIVAGGKISGYSGIIPGILEEVLLAIKKKIPIYLLGGFGGMTAKLCELRCGIIDESKFIKIISEGIPAKELDIFNHNNSNRWNLSKIYKEIKNYNKFNLYVNDKFQFSKDIFFIVQSLMEGLSKCS